MKPVIAASILSANFARIAEEVDAVLQAGADWIHLDVMDNHYVPNLTVGPMMCEALRQEGVSAPIDVHLMTKPVDRLIEAFAKAGATLISFHPEASEDANRSIALIQEHGCQAALALNPATPIDCLHSTLEKLSMVLVMSVNPGFGGQAFIPTVLPKLQKIREAITASGKKIRLEVDGGIKAENIHEVFQAGADTFVVGSGIFKNPPYANIIAKLKANFL